MVWSGSRQRGIGVGLIEVARDEAKAAECAWLHVDFDDYLRPFCYGAVGFTPTNGDLINLTELNRLNRTHRHSRTHRPFVRTRLQVLVLFVLTFRPGRTYMI